MSGVRRLIVGDITHSSVRGPALGDALARELNTEEKSVEKLKAKIDRPAKKVYGNKK